MDYGTRIAEATNTKNASYGTYNQYAGQADQAYNKYNQQFDQRQGYGDIYDAARNRYMNTDEINAAKGAYQNARDAVDQINTTINRLPESINRQYAGTGLTEAQRQRALQSQYNDLVNTQNYTNMSYQKASNDYGALRNEGLQQSMHTADTENSNQWQALDALQNDWRTLLGQRNTSYGQYQNDLAALAGINSEQDKNRQLQEQMALERWKEEQANARAAADRNAELNLQKYLEDSKAASNNDALKLQAALQEKQNKADYNRYVSQTKKGAVDTVNKGMDDWWARMWGGDPYQQRLNDDYNSTIKNMLSYDQWVGNL